MKKLLLSLLIVFSLIPLLQADIVITQKMEGGELSGNMVLRVKGDKVRMDIADQISILLDAASGDATTLMHAQKLFMKADKAMLQQMLAASGGAEAVYKPLGKTEEVNGYKTELYSSTSTVGGQKVESTLWIAKDHPDAERFEKLSKVFEKTPFGDLAKVPDDIKGVPVKAVTKGVGEADTTVTLVSVKEETLDDALFTPPADYKTFTMPAIPGR